MTNYNTDKGEALGWDQDEYSDEGGFTLLPAGTYQFQVSGFERKRFDGSEKMAPCPKADLKLTVITETGVETVNTSLMLNTKTAWRVAQFFEGLGFQKNPETGKVPAKWTEIIGKGGYLELGPRKYTSNGQERQTNEVVKYLKPSEWPSDAQPQQAQPAYQQPYQQAAYQQPQYQQQMPMQQVAPQPQYQHPNQGYVM